MKEKIHILLYFSVYITCSWRDLISSIFLFFLAFNSDKPVAGIVEVPQSSCKTCMFCKTLDCPKLLIGGYFPLKVFTAALSPAASKPVTRGFLQNITGESPGETEERMGRPSWKFAAEPVRQLIIKPRRKPFSSRLIVKSDSVLLQT